MLEQADDIAGALQTLPRGTLRLHCATQIVQFVAPVLADYLKSYPPVTANLTIAEHVVDVIAEGFDLSIRLTPPPDSSLIVRSLATWRHVLCGWPGYLAQHGSLRQLSDLAGHNCLRHVLYPYDNDWRFTDTADKTASVQISGNLISNSGETLRIAACVASACFWRQDSWSRTISPQGDWCRCCRTTSPSNSP